MDGKSIDMNLSAEKMHSTKKMNTLLDPSRILNHRNKSIKSVSRSCQQGGHGKIKLTRKGSHTVKSSLKANDLISVK